MKMNSAIIGVGSNISPEENVAKAEKEVALLGRFIRKSSFFYTKPLVYEKQDDFLNGVFHLETLCDYKELNDRLKKIENKLGRVRTENKFGPRTIDLDTVIFNNQVKDADVFERDFIKNPVTELLPELSDTLNCSNYRNSFTEIHQIIEKIFLLLSDPPLSVLGAGNWFCCRDSPADGIDIIVVLENPVDLKEEFINRELNVSGLNKIGSFFVHFWIFRSDEIEDLSAGKFHQRERPARLRLFANELSSYKLLYGKPIHFSKH